MRQIATVLARHGLRKGLISPVGLRLALEDLGPTFVKIGQMLSTRPDLLPQRYIDEFQRLQDEVKPEDPSTIRRIIESNLGQRLDALFAWFDETPIASASIAQVHLARLPGGERAVVKVQRPGVRETMAADIDLLKHAAGFLRFSPHGRVLDPAAVLDEIAETTRDELDFMSEAANMERFAGFNRQVKYVTCPRVFREYTTRDILVMEHIEGIKISDVESLDREGYDLHDIGTKLAHNYFKQVFVDGFFHADPHPGNIVIQGLRIAYLDFGIMGELSEQMRQGFNLLLSGIVDRDVEMMARSVMRIGVKRGDIDQRQIHADIESIYGRYADTALADLDLPRLVNDVFRICRKNGISLRREMTMLLRGIATLEGVVSMVASDVNIVDVAAPYVRSYLTRREHLAAEIRNQVENLYSLSRVSSRIPRRLLDLLNNAVNGKLRVQFDLGNMDRGLAQVSRMTNRLVFGLVLSALIIGSSVVLNSGIGPYLYGLPAAGILGYSGAALMGFWLLISILRSGRM